MKHWVLSACWLPALNRCQGIPGYHLLTFLPCNVFMISIAKIASTYLLLGMEDTFWHMWHHLDADTSWSQIFMTVVEMNFSNIPNRDTVSSDVYFIKLYEKQDCLSRVSMAERHRYKTAKIKLLYYFIVFQINRANHYIWTVRFECDGLFYWFQILWNITI